MKINDFGRINYVPTTQRCPQCKIEIPADLKAWAEPLQRDPCRLAHRRAPGTPIDVTMLQHILARRDCGQQRALLRKATVVRISPTEFIHVSGLPEEDARRRMTMQELFGKLHLLRSHAIILVQQSNKIRATCRD